MNYNYIVNPLTNRKVKVDGELGRKIINSYINHMKGGFEFNEKGSDFFYNRLKANWGNVFSDYEAAITGNTLSEEEYWSAISAHDEGLKDAVLEGFANDIDKKEFLKPTDIVVFPDGTSKILNIEGQVKEWYLNQPSLKYSPNMSGRDKVIDLNTTLEGLSDSAKMEKLLSYPDHTVIATAINNEFIDYDEETDEDEFEFWMSAKNAFVRPYIDEFRSILQPQAKAVISSIRR